jgi:hypothetical protein
MLWVGRSSVAIRGVASKWESEGCDEVEEQSGKESRTMKQQSRGSGTVE